MKFKDDSRLRFRARCCSGGALLELGKGACKITVPLLNAP
ncbi:uncharacterized protein METZ01_LOCUS386974, partial [marine metagenome]